MAGEYRILLAGGTGFVGGLVLQRLAARSDVASIAAVGRKAAPAAGKVTHMVTDFASPPAGLAETYDAVLLCLGTTAGRAGSEAAFERVEHDFALAVARWGRERGARTCANISALGADSASRSPYLRTEGRTETDLSALGFPSLHLFRPSFFRGRPSLNWRERAGAMVCEAAWRLGLGPEAIRPIAGAALAAAIVASLDDPRRGVRTWHYREIAALAELDQQ